MENNISFSIILNNNTDSFKKSIYTSCSPRDSTHSNTTITIEKATQLSMNTSPTDLMSMIQQQQQPWKLRTKDVAVQEILLERREAMETGSLKGRRLFGPIQRRTTILNYVLSGEDDMRQECEVRSLSFDYSEHETYSPPPPPPSSSPRTLSCDSLDKDTEVKKEQKAQDVCNVAEARVGNGGRYIILPGVIAIASLIFAIYKSWVRRFEEHEVILVPT